MRGFLLVALAGTLLQANPAAAAWTRQHAFACRATRIHTDGFNPELVESLGGALANRSPYYGVDVICPWHDSSSLRRQDVIYLNVEAYLHNGDAQIVAKSCVTAWDNRFTFTACDTQATATGTYGHKSLALPHSFWWTSAFAADFGYVYVRLPQANGPVEGFMSAITGIFASN